MSQTRTGRFLPSLSVYCREHRVIGTSFDQFKSAILAVSLPSCTPTAYLLGRQNGGGGKEANKNSNTKPLLSNRLTAALRLVVVLAWF